jgi:hypothetical protein
MTMFVYIDESGDTGFKFPASSRFFIVTLLLVDDPIPLHNAIDELRQSLGFAPRNEFKFYKSDDTVRRAFLAMLRRQDFTARIVVIDKHLMTQPHMRKRDTFYNFVVKMVLTYDNGTISNATLILDESVKSKQSKQQFTSYLRKSLNSNSEDLKIKAIRYHASHADNLIQAADMISGAVYAKHNKGDWSYFEIIQAKISDEWIWHPKMQ